MKLAFAFDLMDEDQDGRLTKRGLWKYFRAFLASLMTVAGASLKSNSEDLITLCDDCAVWTAAKLLESLRSQNPNGAQSGGCTFKDLADWYTQGGYQIATWLELLDLSKWLPLNRSEVSQQQQQQQHQYLEREDESDTSECDDTTSSSSSSSSSENNEDSYENQFMQQSGKKDPENPYVEEDGPEIFRSDLFDGSSLSLVESDSNFVLQVSQLTGFYNLTPHLLIQRLQEFACDEVITIGEYNAFVSSSVPENLVRGL
jgi:hypothetical protein